MSARSPSLSPQLKAHIVVRAVAEAREAIREGATSPWGDGTVLDSTSYLMDALRLRRDSPVRDAAAKFYVRVFLRTIDAEAPEGSGHVGGYARDRGRRVLEVTSSSGRSLVTDNSGEKWVEDSSGRESVALHYTEVEQILADPDLMDEVDIDTSESLRSGVVEKCPECGDKTADLEAHTAKFHETEE